MNYGNNTMIPGAMMMAPNNYVLPNGGVAIGPNLQKGIATTTKEDEELLKRSGTSEFNITPLMVAEARCNHKNHDGTITVELVDGGNGNRVRCSKCGAEWDLNTPDLKAVEDLVEVLLGVFQTIKLTWLNPPAEYAQQVYTVQNILKQIPAMYKLSQREWNNAEKLIQNQINPGYVSGAGFVQNYPQLQFLGGYNPQMMGQQPMYNQMMMGQPQMMVPQGQPMQPMYNQMMMGQPQMMAPQQMQTPMMSGGTYLPQQSGFVQGGVVPTPGAVDPSMLPQVQAPTNVTGTNVPIVPPIANPATPQVPPAQQTVQTQAKV